MKSLRKNRLIKGKTGKKRAKRVRRTSKRITSKQFGGKELQQFHFYNRFHYGDHILNLKFLYNISNILKEKNILVHYYYDTEYIKNRDELDRYVNSETVTLHPLQEKPPTAIELWMANPIDGTDLNDFERYYNLLYKKILHHLGLQDVSIDTSLFQKEDYLLNIYNNLDSKFKDVDVLIINAEPKSNQFDYDKVKMDELCIKLAKEFKVVTTVEVNSSIPSTLKSGLKMQDIGAISTHAKYIIAVFTGPTKSCLNIHAKNHVKKWFMFDKRDYRFNSIPYTMIHSMDEIDKIVITH